MAHLRAHHVHQRHARGQRGRRQLVFVDAVHRVAPEQERVVDGVHVQQPGFGPCDGGARLDGGDGVGLHQVHQGG
ncbi:hypothetical protein G6F65_021950 [Rhizopus arrhizus]|nr:hypothetical protein G6F65_021950 [Rhizopus arrhizus]